MGKRNAASNKSIISKSGSAKNQKAQILALSKKVNSNSRKLSAVRYTLQHAQNHSGSLVTPYIAAALIQPASWGQVFGSATEVGGGKYTGNKLKLDFHLTPRTEHDRVDCTVIFCSPKNSKVVAETGGATSTTCLPLVNVDYVLWSGMALMNKKRWNVHKVFRISSMPIVTTGAGGTEYINSSRENRRFFTMDNSLKINSRTGNWNTINDHEVNPNQRLHCYVFNDNLSTLEGSPSYHLSVLATGVSSD